MKSFSESYKAAGVDITAGYAAVELMKQQVARTMTPGAIGGLGGFGGLFELDMTGLTHPVLVSGTDGVGTKLKIAFLMDKHDTVVIDCVAMCVNDVITCGAKPLVFLDYIACGKNYPEKIASIVAGVAEGCVQAGAALVGGETAEMPGFYPEQEYDLAGFTVGVVEKSKIIDNTKMQAGDAVIALPSSGMHSNGFSLVRKIFNVEYADIWQHYDELSGTLGETLLTPTKIYVKPVLALMEQVDVRAVSHITGGGFYENIPRALAAGCVAKLEKKSLRMPPIFPLLQKVGKIPERDMFNTFNMGVGMAVVVPGDRADESVRILKEAEQWCEVAVGTDDRLSGWVPREQLAFGDDMDRVKSTFSQKILREECRGRHMYASPDMQSTCPLEEGAWLVGTAGDGLYILLTRMGETFFAPQTWFEEGRG